MNSTAELEDNLTDRRLPGRLRSPACSPTLVGVSLPREITDELEGQLGDELKKGLGDERWGMISQIRGCLGRLHCCVVDGVVDVALLPLWGGAYWSRT